MNRHFLADFAACVGWYAATLALDALLRRAFFGSPLPVEWLDS